MLKRAQLWLERQKQAAERKPALRLDRCTLEPLGEKGGYSAMIDGFNLHPVISPPRVTVGGVLLEDIRFQVDGFRIRGILRQKPRSGRVAIDYGFARAELKGEIWWVKPRKKGI